MIRTPLRPLARILRARDHGENPDAIERENLRLRLEEMRDRQRVRAESRLFVLALFFFGGFGLVGLQMGLLATSAPAEPRAAPRPRRWCPIAPISSTATAGFWQRTLIPTPCMASRTT